MLWAQKWARQNDFEKMNAMYAIALPWFIVTNKHLYARICVDFVYILMAMNVTLLGIFNAHRTVSLLGHHGRNVAYDQANEFENLDTVKFKPTSPDRINVVLKMLNGLKATDHQMRSLLGAQRAEPTEYSPVKENQVEAVLKVLRSKLGADWEAVKRKKTSPFGTGLNWKKVAQQTAQKINAYVTEQLQKEPAAPGVV